MAIATAFFAIASRADARTVAASEAWYACVSSQGDGVTRLTPELEKLALDVANAIEAWLKGFRCFDDGTAELRKLEQLAGPARKSTGTPTPIVPSVAELRDPTRAIPWKPCAAQRLSSGKSSTPSQATSRRQQRSPQRSSRWCFTRGRRRRLESELQSSDIEV